MSAGTKRVEMGQFVPVRGTDRVEMPVKAFAFVPDFDLDPTGHRRPRRQPLAATRAPPVGVEKGIFRRQLPIAVPMTRDNRALNRLDYRTMLINDAGL
jgi:hypothetical protein